MPTDADLRMVILQALRSIADGGSVVIVSHAASFALAGREGLRVLVTGSVEMRAQRLATSRGLDPRAASQLVKHEDAGRADYLKRFYAVDRELPTHFDLVVNTDAMTIERSAHIVVSAAAGPLAAVPAAARVLVLLVPSLARNCAGRRGPASFVLGSR